MILGVLVLAIIIGIVIPSAVYRHRAAQFQAQKDPSATAGQSGKTTTVAYTNKGFEPETATIPVGSTVVWTNQSEKQMWVASDPHPAHNTLPGFDQSSPKGNEDNHDEKGSSLLQKSGLVQTVYAHEGVTYKYTFTMTGTWAYHNHLSPNDRGKIIVN